MLIEIVEILEAKKCVFETRRLLHTLLADLSR